MIDRILSILAANRDGLTPAQLLGALGLTSAGDLTDSLATVIGDGRVERAEVGGVDVYRLVAPPAPKPKAAPTSRMVPIALLDALAEAVDGERGMALTLIVARVQALAEMRRAAGDLGVTWSNVSPTPGTWTAAIPHTSAPSTSPPLPDGWSAVYTCDGAEVRPTTRGRWEWAVGVEGEDGSGVCADLANALAKADAVRALS